MLIFDLDYTLLDTAELKKDLAVILGVSNDEFSGYEQELKSRGGQYNHVDHISYILDKMQLSGDVRDVEMERLQRKVKIFMLSIDHYFFTGAEKLLQELKKGSEKMLLFTKGDVGWQNAKINSSKILSQYFDGVVVDSKAKDENLLWRALSQDEKLITLVNDNLEEGIKMQNKIQQIGLGCRLVVVSGPYSRDKKEATAFGVEYVDGMNDLAKKAFGLDLEKGNEVKLESGLRLR